jgi:hypothetical protein
MATIQGVSRILTVSLTRLAGQAGLASFSLPGIISDDTPNATFGASNRAKKYLVSELSQVGTDFGTSTATYKAANAIVSQSPKVKSFYIIKTGTNVAQEKTITWSADFAAGEVITGTVNGDAISVAWDTDQATTMGNLNTAIAAAYGIDTSAGTANVNTVTSDAGYQVDISISAAGGDEPTATIATSTAGRTIADDISDALAETSTALWYALYYAGTNEGSMWEGTVSAEANELLFAFQSNAGPIKTVATTDIMSRIKAAGYLRTFGTYRETLTDHAPAALISRVIQADNGSITFWGKTLVGVTPDALTSAELAFVEGKNCNNYCYIAGAGNFQPGVCADGTSIQTTWDLDYFVNKLIEKLLTILRSRDKTNFDRDGLALVRANGQGVMNDMVKQNIFAQETSTINAATFTVPDIDDLDAADITAHLLDDCTYDAVYLDGIRKIDVNGNVQIGGA